MTKKEIKDQDEIHRLAVIRFKIATDEDEAEHKEYADDTKFAINDNGCQWPADIRTTRSDPTTGARPCLVLNKIPEKIDQVEGEFRQLRPAIKVRAVDSKADPNIADIKAGIIRHIEYQSDARTAYNTSHSSVLHGGRGAWEIDVEQNESDPWIKDIVINRIPNVSSVYWDVNAKKKDKSDAEYIFIVESLTEKAYKAQYPDNNIIDWEDSGQRELWRPTDQDSKQRMVRIAKYWWKEKEDKTFYRVTRDDNEITVETKDPKDKLIAEQTIQVNKVRWCIMNGREIIYGPKDWPGKYIPIVIEIGKEVNIAGKQKTRGMTRFAKEPQQMYNYWSSAVTEQIALAPKAPYLATAKMIANHQTQWDQAHMRNYMYLLFDADSNMPGYGPKREAPPQLSTALANELMRAEHDIMSAMNIYEASLGDRGEEKSGKAIIARQKQGSVGSYTYTDNFQTALIYSTKIILDLMPHVYDTERIVRILGDDDSEQEIPINARNNAPFMENFKDLSKNLMVQNAKGYINDMSEGVYDVRVTIGPSYTTQRQEALELLVALAEKIPQFGLAAIDLIVKNMDVPGAEELLERCKKLVPPGLREPEPGEEQIQAQEPPPDPKVMLEMKKLELAGITEMRKSYEGHAKAIADMMKAEAVERGEQLAEMTALMNELRTQMMPEQGAQQTNQPTGGPNATQ